MSLTFHWRLPQGGDTGGGATRAMQATRAETALPDLPAQLDFCRQAEQCGIDSVLVDLNVAKPDPIALATALAVRTQRVKFIIAARSGLLSPTLFVQQINTLSTLSNGRVSLNVVAGTARNAKTIEEVRRACVAAGAECLGDVRGRAKAELYAGARALLLPTRLNEGCPLVIIEALMSGTPVIASARGGCPDMVTPDVGFICETVDDYARAVAATGDILPEACRRHALERYHYLRMSQDYVREYRREMETMGS
jgi:glycosyltransferase involved in cell wall biosynthesis